MTVTVFGLGFVGLTTALGLAHMGHQVYGVEIDPVRRDVLLGGALPFHEPYMEGELRAQLANGNFCLTASVEQAVENSGIVFYCVGTPYGQDGAADLTFLLHAVSQTLKAIHDNAFRVLVTKSTVPPSTTEQKIAPYVAANAPACADICVANNPEFLREGYCWKDFMEADRIVIGCNNERGRECLRDLYAPLDVPTFCVSPSTAEFIKYLSNSMLATLISYSNEMAQVGETIGGIQVAEAFRILHMDKRWKSGGIASYAYPGCGYGGYCLPKDTCALRAQARQHGMEPRILDMVIETNEQRPYTMAKRIVSGAGRGERIGIAGLTFKPDSDDVRESSAYKIISCLKEMGYCHIRAYDPIASSAFQRAYPDLEIAYCSDLDDLCSQSDRIAITTAWPQFSVLAKWGGGPLIDCRYMLREHDYG